MKRRDFLKFLPAAAAPIALAACNTPVAPTANPQTTSDVALISEAAVMEARSIKSYDAALDSFIRSEAAIQIARLYRAHHLGHLNELNALLAQFSQPRVSLETATPFPQVGRVTDEASAVRLALELEYEAAAAYNNWVNNPPTTPEVRRFIANTYPIELAHYIELRSVLGLTPPIASGAFESLPKP